MTYAAILEAYGWDRFAADAAEQARSWPLLLAASYRTADDPHRGPVLEAWLPRVAGLPHARSLRLSRGESTWLRGNTFYGKRQMFRPDFMEWFEGLQLPPYHLEKRDGQYNLTFEGSKITRLER